jgi:hypothetical protein
VGNKEDHSIDLLTAIQDLSRITIALSGKFDSKADAIRRLSDLGMSPVRVATLLAVPPTTVHAELVRTRKRKGAHRKGKR